VAENKHINIETELSRDLGLISALAIGVGTMIAAGIFSLSGLAIQNVGSAAILSFLLAAVVALFTALTYCEFVSIYPNSGEGYLYARKTFSPPLAFLVGFALFLGYASSCGFYLATFSSYFAEFIWHAPIESITGIIALVLLVLLNVKGTKESGSFQIIVTVAKVILLMWFVVGGLGSIDFNDVYDKFSTDFVKIGSTATLVFITFFGFSAIAASAGEIINPVKTIPRAIFLSMGIVTSLYTMVVLVIIAANLTSYDEAAMGRAAELFLGGIGGMVIVAGGLFSMVSATNASIMAGSRVSFAMSQLGHLPEFFSRVNQKTKTPIPATVLVGGTIFAFILGLSLTGLANFANAVLLLALILVNAALIVHRRKYPHIERPFRVPLVPLLPILGILSNLYLLIQSSLELWNTQGFYGLFPVILAAGSLGVGLVGFILIKGFELPEVPTLEETFYEPVSIHASQLPEKVKYRVLVTLSNPTNLPQLMEMAHSIAKERDGEVIGLRVAVVPEQLSPNRENFSEQFYVTKERPILEMANKYAQENNIPFKSQIDVGHDPARSIIESAQQLECDLIIMGWKGFTTTAERILGEVADNVVSNAKTDLMLVKVVAGSTLNNWLLPTAGGKHAMQAEQYAASIVRAKKGVMTFCSVLPPNSGEAISEATHTILNKAVERVAGTNGLEIKDKIIRNKSVTQGILEESKNHDAIMLGATEHRFKKILFGSIPEVIAKESLKTVVLVKKGGK
jgi:amino acid transporter/nucleotide-binding universal stress UspA family protein